MKAAALSLKECYAMLGVEPGADLDAVKHAYRKRAFELHPDLNPGDGASRDFQKLNEAYVTLLRTLAPSTSPGASGSRPGNARTGHDAYAEQARREREEKERRERKEQERRERREQEREVRERREREEKERREAERRERLQREIDRQEAERRERQAKAKEEKARRDEAFRAAEREREEKLREAERQRGAEPRAEAYRRTYGHTRPTASGPEGRTSAASGGSGAGPGRNVSGSPTEAADTGREELLRELLNDPFARRVYEDIYSEVRNRRNTPSKPAPQPRKFQMEWGGKAFQVDLTGGIGHALKGWMRSQIDEEQELFFPAANLFPGARIRLQIRHGFSGELRTVDITLPQDFAPGKPIRLKGMGKKLGRWQGDLYLTFQIKERGSS